MTWEDVYTMPRAELAEYMDQAKQWASVIAGAELKD